MKKALVIVFTVIFGFPVFGNENNLKLEEYEEVIEEFMETTEDKNINLNYININEEENDLNMIYLGVFRITHYCPCEKCNGKWAGTNKTYSGTDLCPGRTIAVSKSQIPLGTEVIINEHTYVAEDIGSGITDNCIDILVCSHQESMDNGVYYADVYIKEDRDGV